MIIKNSINIVAVISLMTLISCQEPVKKKSDLSKNGKLIAQTDVPKEEKIVSINEVLAYDIGFKKLNEVVKSSEVATIFDSKKSYTLLAPLNGAFERMPEGALEKLLAPENKEQLLKTMKYHIIAGTISEEDMIKAINEGRGSVKLKTLGGSRLIASRKRGKIYLIDENGNSGRLMKTDIKATNGVIHTLERVLLPKK